MESKAKHQTESNRTTRNQDEIENQIEIKIEIESNSNRIQSKANGTIKSNRIEPNRVEASGFD